MEKIARLVFLVLVAGSTCTDWTGRAPFQGPGRESEGVRSQESGFRTTNSTLEAKKPRARICTVRSFQIHYHGVWRWGWVTVGRVLCCAAGSGRLGVPSSGLGCLRSCLGPLDLRRSQMGKQCGFQGKSVIAFVIMLCLIRRRDGSGEVGQVGGGGGGFLGGLRGSGAKGLTFGV